MVKSMKVIGKSVCVAVTNDKCAGALAKTLQVTTAKPMQKQRRCKLLSCTVISIWEVDRKWFRSETQNLAELLLDWSA